MQRLYTLIHGEKFVWNSITYTVQQQAARMTEVFGNNRYWAWPSYVRVRVLAKS